jgi:hypothetical protein
VGIGRQLRQLAARIATVEPVIGYERDRSANGCARFDVVVVEVHATVGNADPTAIAAIRTRQTRLLAVGLMS